MKLRALVSAFHTHRCAMMLHGLITTAIILAGGRMRHHSPEARGRRSIKGLVRIDDPLRRDAVKRFFRGRRQRTPGSLRKMR